MCVYFHYVALVAQDACAERTACRGQVSKVSKIFNCQIGKNCGSFRMFHDLFFGWHQELVPFLDLCSALAGSVGVSLRFGKKLQVGCMWEDVETKPETVRCKKCMYRGCVCS